MNMSRRSKFPGGWEGQNNNPDDPNNHGRGSSDPSRFGDPSAWGEGPMVPEARSSPDRYPLQPMPPRSVPPGRYEDGPERYVDLVAEAALADAREMARDGSGERPDWSIKEFAQSPLFRDPRKDLSWAMENMPAELKEARMELSRRSLASTWANFYMVLAQCRDRLGGDVAAALKLRSATDNALREAYFGKDYGSFRMEQMRLEAIKRLFAQNRLGTSDSMTFMTRLDGMLDKAKTSKLEEKKKALEIRRADIKEEINRLKERRTDWKTKKASYDASVRAKTDPMYTIEHLNQEAEEIREEEVRLNEELADVSKQIREAKEDPVRVVGELSVADRDEKSRRIDKLKEQRAKLTMPDNIARLDEEIEGLRAEMEKIDIGLEENPSKLAVAERFARIWGELGGPDSEDVRKTPNAYLRACCEANKRRAEFIRVLDKDKDLNKVQGKNKLFDVLWMKEMAELVHLELQAEIISVHAEARIVTKKRWPGLEIWHRISDAASGSRRMKRINEVHNENPARAALGRWFSEGSFVKRWMVHLLNSTISTKIAGKAGGDLLESGVEAFAREDVNPDRLEVGVDVQAPFYYYNPMQVTEIASTYLIRDRLAVLAEAVINCTDQAGSSIRERIAPGGSLWPRRVLAEVREMNENGQLHGRLAMELARVMTRTTDGMLSMLPAQRLLEDVITREAGRKGANVKGLFQRHGASRRWLAPLVLWGASQMSGVHPIDSHIQEARQERAQNEVEEIKRLGINKYFRSSWEGFQKNLRTSDVFKDNLEEWKKEGEGLSSSDKAEIIRRREAEFWLNAAKKYGDSLIKQARRRGMSQGDIVEMRDSLRTVVDKYEKEASQ